MTAGLGSGEEIITSATHSLVHRLVYSRRKQVSSALPSDNVNQNSRPQICCAMNETNGASFRD